MYLFSRQATLRGGARRPLQWATEITGLVNDRTDRHVALWMASFGAPLGTFVWSSWVESQAELAASFATVNEDEEYHGLVEDAQDLLVAPPEDSYHELVRGQPRETPPVPGNVVLVTAATIAGGKYGDAIAWGSEMAELVEGVTALPTSFLLSAYGTFGRVTWLGAAPDLATADAAGQAINLDEEYLKRLGDVGELFIPGSGNRALLTCIA
jgi:hypothetical protein